MTTTTATTTTGTTGTGQAAGKATVDYESFLKLLTAQLRNQDPLSPMDATQFMTQLAQLSTVEQGVRTNETLTQVLDTLKSSGMRLDMAYLGRQVEASSDRIALAGGEARMAYAVDGTAASVTVEVLNSAGTTIHKAAGATGTGRQTFTWNGRTASGGTAADGVYTVKVTAKDKDGKALDVATVVTGTVSEVRTEDGATRFLLGNGITVGGGDILSAS